MQENEESQIENSKNTLLIGEISKLEEEKNEEEIDKSLIEKNLIYKVK